MSGPIENSRSASQVLRPRDIDSVRRVILERVATSATEWTLEAIANAAHTSVDLLQERFGRSEQLIDEVVAGTLRRARPVIRADVDHDVDLDEVVKMLVRRRLVVHEEIGRVWHLIGQGDASAQEFDALRATLLADVDCRMERRITHLEAYERVEAIRLIDGAISLPVIHDLRVTRPATFSDAARLLTARVNDILEEFEIRPQRRHLRVVRPPDEHLDE